MSSLSNRNSAERPLNFTTQSLAAFAIASVTLLTYAPVISNFYLYADEAWAFGSALPNTDLWRELVLAAETWGRPIGMFIQWLQSLPIEANLNLLILNRIGSLLCVGSIAWQIFRALPQRALDAEGQGWLAIAVAVALVIIPPAQILAAFSILLGPALALMLSFASYQWLDRRWGWIATLLATLICLTTYQPSAFFIFVAFTAEVWRRYEAEPIPLRDFVIRRGLTVIALVATASIIFSIWFKMIATGSESHLYERARPLFAMMNGDFGPFATLFEQALTGLNIFEIWSYPPYTPYIWYTRTAIYLAFLLATVALNVVLVARARTAEEKRRRQWVILAFVGAFVATLPPVVADGFSARQNLYYSSQAILILNLAFVISLLLRTYRGFTRAAAVAAVVLVIQASWASHGVTSTIIRPQLLAVDYVATKLRESGLRPGSEIAIAVTVSRTSADCVYEPCQAFYGRRLNADFELNQKGFYQRIAERYGYTLGAFGVAPKPMDVQGLNLGEAVVVIDIDEMRAIYAADKIQM